MACTRWPETRVRCPTPWRLALLNRARTAGDGAGHWPLLPPILYLLLPLFCLFCLLSLLSPVYCSLSPEKMIIDLMLPASNTNVICLQKQNKNWTLYCQQICCIFTNRSMFKSMCRRRSVYVCWQNLFMRSYSNFLLIPTSRHPDVIQMTTDSQYYRFTKYLTQVFHVCQLWIPLQNNVHKQKTVKTFYNGPTPIHVPYYVLDEQ